MILTHFGAWNTRAGTAELEVNPPNQVQAKNVHRSMSENHRVDLLMCAKSRSYMRYLEVSRRKNVLNISVLMKRHQGVKKMNMLDIVRAGIIVSVKSMQVKMGMSIIPVR